MSSSSKLTEKSPLLSSAPEIHVLDDTECNIYATIVEDDDIRVNDPMTYNLGWLKRWAVFRVLRSTIWDNPGLWMVMGKLLGLALFVAILAYNFMPDPEHLDASKFSAMTNVITLFVTLMLSFFLTSSINRWVRCVDGFLDLFNAIRNLAMQLHALGVEADLIKRCLRYGVLSAIFLVHELRTLKFSTQRKEEAKHMFWEKLDSMDATEYCCVFPGEREVLEPISDTAGQMWIWVGSFVGRMANDGHVPPMASPTYGRIMNIGQNAQESLRRVRTELIVQMPFVYVHTLATLVHVNSILLAINLGFATGCTYHGIRMYANQHYYHVEGVQAIPLTEQIQTFALELTKGILGPLLFQAFLEIGIAVVSPFDECEAAIPVSRLMRNLERDLGESFTLAENTPGWEKPSFKYPKPSQTAPKKA